MNKYDPGEKLGNYHQKKGKDKLPLFCSNLEWVIIIYAVQRLRNFQLRWKFLVGPRNISYFDRSATVLVGVASSGVSAYVPNYTLKFFVVEIAIHNYFPRGLCLVYSAVRREIIQPQYHK